MIITNAIYLSLYCLFFTTLQEINFRCKAKLPFPLPWELVLVIISTVASEFGLFNQVYDVDIVSDIPQGYVQHAKQHNIK